MRDYSGNINVLEKSLVEFFSRSQFTLELGSKRGRSSVANITKCQEPLTGVKFGMKDLDSLIFWILFSFYGNDEELRWNVRLELEETLRKNPEIDWTLSLLQSKSNLLLWLIESSYYHPREFYGNVLDPKLATKRVRSLKLLFPTHRKPKKVQRHRGYRDKGTLPSNDTRVRREELRKDILLEILQNDIESSRQSHLDTIEFLKGFYSG